MDDRNQKPTRKQGRHLRVPVLPTEEFEIKSNAIKVGLTTAEYLRRLGLGYEIRGIIDQESILVLSKINADLGRLGGLLKLWLSLDNRVAHFDKNSIEALLSRIRTTQNAMLEAISKL